MTGDGKNQLRGGAGIFTGRTPYVWLSNNFTGTGLQFARLSVTRNAANNIPFVADPDSQPTQVGSATGTAANEYAIVDPDFKFPSVARYNLAYDRDARLGRPGGDRGVPVRGHAAGDPLQERQPASDGRTPRSTAGRPSRASTRRPPRPTC